MGTNYYVMENYCGHCQRGDELHIGKSSGGWCFALQTYPDRGLGTLGDWRIFLDGKEIRDEYGDAVTMDALVRTITERSHAAARAQWWLGYASADEWYQQNHAEPGPNGLARHRIDGHHCIGHGEGTWDYMRGEFS
jgi:hypothetical protein